MTEIRLYGSRAVILVEVAKRTSLSDQPSRPEKVPAFPVSESNRRQSSIQQSGRHIQLGNSERQVNGFVFDPPYDLIEIHAEPGCCALATGEAEAFSRWLHKQ